MFFFTVLDLFLKVLSKRSTWHFSAAWLISQQFIRKDLKVVASVNASFRYYLEY